MEVWPSVSTFDKHPRFIVTVVSDAFKGKIDDERQGLVLDALNEIEGCFTSKSGEVIDTAEYEITTLTPDEAEAIDYN